MVRLYTIGYERLLPPELLNELQVAGVQRLIDVRHRPQSRRPGMSKTRLAALLAEHGIAYEHRRALGTPSDIRWLFRHRREAEGRERFRAHVEATAAAELGSAPATVLMCLEAEPEGCHRRVLAEQLRARRPELEVVDL